MTLLLVHLSQPLCSLCVNYTQSPKTCSTYLNVLSSVTLACIVCALGSSGDVTNLPLSRGLWVSRAREVCWPARSQMGLDAVRRRTHPKCIHVSLACVFSSHVTLPPTRRCSERRVARREETRKQSSREFYDFTSTVLRTKW